MATKRKPRKRIKKSGVVYFATNNRIENIVKIGMTTDTAESRLLTANRKHEFMCGKWSINQKVATNDVKRTEELAHSIFQKFKDSDSVSSEMYFIPPGMTVKKMADDVRDKDRMMQERAAKKEEARAKLVEAELELKRLEAEDQALISLNLDTE